MIHIVDIGSWPEGVPPYQPLLDKGLGRLTEFDPQVNKMAIGDGKDATLYICNYPGWTSLLRPNQETLRYFPFGRNSDVVHELSVKTRRLDDLDIEPIDYLKMDVQGSELLILENGREKLRNCTAVHLEVPFVSLYEHQPLYWQLDQELRQQGFVLHTFVSVKHHSGQLIEADVLYTRDSEVLNIIIESCYSVGTTARAA